jgi:acyl-CoA thioesterase FadM
VIEQNEAGPEVAHGGWTASIFDDVTGHVPLLNGVRSVTRRMTVNYLKRVPIERDLVTRAWPIHRGERKSLVGSELLLASTGALLGTAETVMVLRDTAHFERHRRWLAEQDAAVARREYR